MDASHLRKHIVADDGLVGGHSNAAVTLNHTADGIQLVLDDAGTCVELVFQDDLHAGERGVATTFAKPVDGDVETMGTAIDGGQGVRHGQVVVVVGVEVEVGVGVVLHHLPHIVNHLQRIHNAERVGQHKTPNAGIDEGIHQLIDVLRRVLHTVRPVLQIEVHDDAALMSVGHFLSDVFDVLFRRLAQLLRAVLQRTLGQQVNHPTAAVGNPVDASVPVDEAEHLHPVYIAGLLGIAANHLHAVPLTVADACRPHLNAVDVEVVQQHTGYHQFLVRQERDAIGLLAVAERGVKNLDKGPTPYPSPREGLLVSCIIDYIHNGSTIISSLPLGMGWGGLFPTPLSFPDSVPRSRCRRDRSSGSASCSR